MPQLYYANSFLCLSLEEILQRKKLFRPEDTIGRIETDTEKYLGWNMS